jgi:hypothetical protein
MGLFGDDERQDARLDALEEHIRTLTEAVQRNQMDTAACRADLLRLQAQVDAKISAEDVDPALAAFNDDLRAARKAVDESAQAASQSWAKLQEGVTETLESLRKSLSQASERLQKETS